MAKWMFGKMDEWAPADDVDHPPAVPTIQLEQIISLGNCELDLHQHDKTIR